MEEYFLFDPYGDYLEPQLQGYRLQGRRYHPLPSGPDGSLESRTTGLTLVPEGERVRLVVTATGERLLWEEELGEALRASEARAAEEARAREDAEARAVAEARAREESEQRVRALEEELKKLRSSRT